MVVWSIKANSFFSNHPSFWADIHGSFGSSLSSGCPINTIYTELTSCQFTPNAKTRCSEAKLQCSNEINNVIKITRSSYQTPCWRISQYLKGCQQEHARATDNSQKPTCLHPAQGASPECHRGRHPGTVPGWMRISLGGMAAEKRGQAVPKRQFLAWSFA